MRFFKSAKIISAVFAYFSLAILLASCASSGDPSARAGVVPGFIELEDELSISTFHFPRGVYSLDSEDGAGYYYRAPRSLIKHSFAGSDQYQGGIFVRKGDRRNLRGYVIWAGGRTRIGNLSRAHYAFRD